MSEKDLQEIISQMSKIAQQDGKITTEEQDLLVDAQVSLLTYEQALEEALADGVIDETEEELLLGFKEQIIQGAWEIAKESQGVTDDELKLLEVLIHKLRK